MKSTRTAQLAFGFVALLALTRADFEGAFTVAAEKFEVLARRGSLEEGAPTLKLRGLLGAYRPEVPWTAIGLQSLSRQLGKPVQIASFYVPWGLQREERFPAERLGELHDSGHLPMITWEPWLIDFGDRTPTDARKRSDLSAITRGDFDDYVRTWARGAIRFGHPLLLRFAHEMDNPRYAWSTAFNSPQDYVAAWIHVRSIFQDEGARNVLWVWSPHEQISDALWPGADQVDLIGLSVFNYGALHNEGWIWPEDVIDPLWTAVARFEKPVLVAELGCVHGREDRAAWYRRAAADVLARPDAFGLVFFDHPKDLTFPGHEIDWSIDPEPRVMSQLRVALNHPSR